MRLALVVIVVLASSAAADPCKPIGLYAEPALGIGVARQLRTPTVDRGWSYPDYTLAMHRVGLGARLQVCDESDPTDITIAATMSYTLFFGRPRYTNLGTAVDAVVDSPLGMWTYGGELELAKPRWTPLALRVGYERGDTTTYAAGMTYRDELFVVGVDAVVLTEACSGCAPVISGAVLATAGLRGRPGTAVAVLEVAVGLVVAGWLVTHPGPSRE